MTPTTGEQRRAALDAALAVLACPVCLEPMAREGSGLVCDRGHRHDVARQGYASLAPGSRAHGDTAPMVAARSAFLAARHFSGVEAAVVASVPDGAAWCVDLASGPGHYLAAVLDARPALHGIALDVSAPAARSAAGARPRMAAATADVWRRLPLRDGAIDHVLDVFGPRNGTEFARVLAPGGAVTVVTPLPQHLAELRDPFGTMGIANDKQDRVDAGLAPLVRASSVEVVDRRTLTERDAVHAVLMGPNGHHLAREATEGTAARLGSLDVTIAVSIATYRHATSIVSV